MLNVILIFLTLAALSIPFIDIVVLRKAHKRLLRRKVRAWLNTVEHYDKLQLALACVAKVNALIDRAFGPKLLSRRVVLRGSIISSCLLVMTLAGIGLVNKQPFGVTPWQYYRDSVRGMLASIEALFTQSTLNYMRQIDLTQPGPFYRNTNAFVLNINSNYFLCEVRTNAIKSIVRMEPLGRGSLVVHYYRIGSSADKPQSSTNMFGKVTQPTNPVDDLDKHARAWKLYLKDHDRLSYIALYSAAYFIALFAINAALFILSLGFCRIVLREIAASGRLISTTSLVALNLIVVFTLSCFVLLVFTILAFPLLWVFIPFIVTASDQSIYTLTVVVVASSVSLWLSSGTSAKLVALIVLLPGVFAAIMGLFSLLAIRWKRAFHYLLKAFLVRCVETNPITVVVSTVTFLSGMLVLIAKKLHIFGFL